MIEFRNINYQVGSTEILKDISFTLPEGEFAAIVGPNGAGKSSLIRILLTLLQPSSGEVLINGIPNRIWLKSNTIAYLPQKEAYDRSFPANALDIALMAMVPENPSGWRFTRAQIRKAESYLDLCGVLRHRHARIGTLSGGEFQRVLLARALATESKYLILDEPEAGIDQPGVKSFFEILKGVHALGRTIITISHDLHTLTSYCSFLICLNITLHCHSRTELLTSETIHKTFGDAIHLVDKHY